MLEHTNREIFDKRQMVCSWPSENRLATMAGLSSGGIRKARAGLRRKGVVAVMSEGGKGPRSTSVYVFNPLWAQNAKRDLDERQKAAAGVPAFQMQTGSPEGPWRFDKGLRPARKRGDAGGPESSDKSFEEIGSRRANLSHTDRVGERNMHSRKTRRQWCDLISEAMQRLRLSRVEANALMNLLTREEIEELSSLQTGSDQFKNILQKAIERQKAANSV
jgi:hypothetical protein